MDLVVHMTHEPDEKLSTLQHAPLTVASGIAINKGCMRVFEIETSNSEPDLVYLIGMKWDLFRPGLVLGIEDKKRFGIT